MKTRVRRSMVLGTVILSLLLLSPSSAQETDSGIDHRAVLGEPLGTPLSGKALTEETERIAGLMRCVSCQGLSIAASAAPAALAMKDEVRQLLADGYDEEQVLGYFEAGFGEFIRLAPKPEGFNLVVWIAPVAGLLLGVALVALRFRGRSTAEAPADQDEGLDEYLDQVRREVQG